MGKTLEYIIGKKLAAETQHTAAALAGGNSVYV